MQLSMTVLRCPDQIAPEARTVSGGEFHVGRGPDVDWVLPDPDRLLSKRHFAVAFRGGDWQVADTSTNGTYLNTEPEAIGRGAPRSLRDGDRLRLGAYEIEIRLVDQPAQGAGNSYGAGMGGRSGQSPFNDPFAEDPLAPPPADRRPFDEPPAYGQLGAAPTNARLPHDFDPLAPDHDETPFGGGFRGPVQSDHSSSMEDAMMPPPIAGYAAPHAGGIIPADDLLPDDWDKDLLEGIAPPGGSAPIQPLPVQTPSVQAPAVQSPSIQSPSIQAPPPRSPVPPPPARVPPAVAAPVVRQRTPRPATPPPAPPDADPFGDPDARPARQPIEAPSPAAAAIGQSISPFDEPPDAPRDDATPPAPAEQQKAAAVPRATDDAGAMAAFLRGAGLGGVTPADPIATMTGLGQAFRAMISGLRAVLIARATIKNEFRIEQTMIRAHGNNPLKFSANDDDALGALLGLGRRSDMTPAVAVEDSLRDLRLHELATMAAMQVAVRAMLEELSPEKIRSGTEQGGITMLPAQRKARAWEAFEARHATVVRALVDDFDSIFGKTFARAYERALDEISLRERQ